MTSGTVSSLFVLLLSCSSALAQQAAQFNQVLNINGDMTLNSFQFQDGSRVETFSQKQQQLIVNQQAPSISANQVTGSTGNPFVALQQNSLVISTDGATDLVGGQIEMAINVQTLAQAKVDPANTFVAMLSPDRQTWVIQEAIRSINNTDATVRMVKLQTIDGEYLMLGRQTDGTATQLTPFGSDASTQVVIQGTGLQENEFQDGLRMSIKATQPLTMNVDVKKGLDSSMLTALQGQASVNDFRYSVITSLGGVTTGLNQQVTVIQMPLNAARIQSMMQAAGVAANGQVALGVAQRGVLGNPGGATNFGGAAAAPLLNPQKRGRVAFRSALSARQNGQGQNGQGQGQKAQGQNGQNAGNGQNQQGQNQNGQNAQNQQGQAGQNQAGQGQAGAAQQAGQQQQGTPTVAAPPVATELLLEPTFTPITANVVLDAVNMRIAFPVAQLDGEFILTMQTGAGAAAAPAAPAPAGEAANATAPAARMKRQDAATEGQVTITMNEVTRMVDSQKWGGQAPITEIMTNYVKANNGTNGTETA